MLKMEHIFIIKPKILFLLSAAPNLKGANKMRCAFIVMGLCAYSLSEAAPLDLGGGGVFKGAEAQGCSSIVPELDLSHV